jgi:predicted nucleotidyltransferase
MSVKVDLIQAQRVWEKNSSVAAVWSFGSAKDGIVAPGSDLDIAVLFSSLPNIEQLAELRADLQDVFDFDSIDLLILNSAGTISSMEAVSGKILFCRDRNKRAEFVSLVARQYEDDMAFLEKYL